MNWKTLVFEIVELHDPFMDRLDGQQTGNLLVADSRKKNGTLEILINATFQALPPPHYLAFAAPCYPEIAPCLTPNSRLS